jgi:hypothetical protein
MWTATFSTKDLILREKGGEEEFMVLGSWFMARVRMICAKLATRFSAYPLLPNNRTRTRTRFASWAHPVLKHAAIP